MRTDYHIKLTIIHFYDLYAFINYTHSFTVLLLVLVLNYLEISISLFNCDICR